MNYEEHCRLCLQLTIPLQSIFTPNEQFKPLTNAYLAMACSSILIFQDDGYPQHVCQNCVTSLQQVYAFKIQCEKSEQTLKQKIHTDLSWSTSSWERECPNNDFFETSDRNSKCSMDSKIDSHYDGCSNLKQSKLIDRPKDQLKSPKKDKTKYGIGLTRNCRLCNISFSGSFRDHVNDAHDETFQFDKYINERSKFKDLSSDDENSCKSPNTNQKNVEKSDKLHSKSPHICVICEKRFGNVTLLRAHVKRKHLKDSYECKICMKRMKTYATLQNHVRYVHGKLEPLKENLCPYCGYTSRYNLDRHLKVHLNERAFECKDCGKRFVLETEFKRHYSHKHSEEKNYACDICGKTFALSIQLKRHKVMHSTERNFKCNVCDKSFKAKGHLRYHKLTHSEETRVECHICKQKLFKYYFSRHLLIHSDEKLYECGFCAKKFTHYSAMMTHKKHVHMGVKRPPKKKKLKKNIVEGVKVE